MQSNGRTPNNDKKQSDNTNNAGVSDNNSNCVKSVQSENIYNNLTDNLHAKKMTAILQQDKKSKVSSKKNIIINYLSKTVNKIFGIKNSILQNKKIVQQNTYKPYYQRDDSVDYINQTDNDIAIESLTENINNTHIASCATDEDVSIRKNELDFFQSKLSALINHSNLAEKLSLRNYKYDIISINLILSENKKITGKQLLPQISAAGLLYGDMSIFHRYSNTDGTGKILFSLANGIEPGIFDLDDFENTQIDVLTFFMTIPGPDTLMQAFASMINTATVFSEHFNVELKDKDFCDITTQRIEHYRQNIRDFQRRQLVVKSS